MNPLIERYSDLLGDQDDSDLLACVADLDAARDVLTIPPACDAEISRVLSASSPPIGSPMGLSLHRLISPPWHSLRRRLVPLLLAVLLVGTGLGAYLHNRGAAPVSAQTILRRASAAGPGPNQATHATYRISSADGRTGTADVWTRYDAGGKPAEFGLTWTGTAPPQMPAPGVKGLVLGAQLAQQLSTQPNDYTVERTSLEGISVYALQSTTGVEATYFFDAHSYVLEGIDWVDSRLSWHIRLASYTIMPVSAVPAGTWHQSDSVVRRR